MGREACPCTSRDDVKSLVQCLAPPPGDYELVLEGFAGAMIVVNDEGIWIRSIARDEWLPFIESRDRPASMTALEQALRINGIGWDELLCMTVRALKEAAGHGSLRAARRLSACRSLVEEIEESCREEARGPGDRVS